MNVLGNYCLLGIRNNKWLILRFNLLKSCARARGLRMSPTVTHRDSYIPWPQSNWIQFVLQRCRWFLLELLSILSGISESRRLWTFSTRTAFDVRVESTRRFPEISIGNVGMARHWLIQDNSFPVRGSVTCRQGWSWQAFLAECYGHGVTELGRETRSFIISFKFSATIGLL